MAKLNSITITLPPRLHKIYTAVTLTLEVCKYYGVHRTPFEEIPQDTRDRLAQFVIALVHNADISIQLLPTDPNASPTKPDEGSAFNRN